MTNVNEELLRDTLEGLRGAMRSIPCKYFYDAEGSELFDAITETEDYYPTRTELSILTGRGEAIAAELGPNRRVIEFGSGSGIKTELLLEALDSPRSYTPIEISESALAASTRKLRERFPDIAIEPLLADYTAPFDLTIPTDDRVVFFPGSTIGNFEREEARDFLERCARVAGGGGSLLIGVDLKKDPVVLHRAYNDSEGVTEAFNKNLLVRLNREIGSDFEHEAWRHYAYYEPRRGRIEVFLVSLKPQTVTVAGESFEFALGEPIHTEYSHKYTVQEFEDLGGEAGWRMGTCWTDQNDWFALIHFIAT